MSSTDPPSSPLLDDDSAPVENYASTIATSEHILRKDTKSKRDHLHEAERFIAFTDAVVAIAMTLLILPLMEVASDIGTEESEVKTASEFFKQHGSQIGSLAVNFFVISKFWLVHYHLYGYVGHVTMHLVILNFWWMFAIIFFPICASLAVQGTDGDVVAVAAYVGTVVVISVLNLLTCVLIRNDEKTWKFDHPPGMLLVFDIAISVFIMVVVLIVSLLKPEYGLMSLLLLLAGNPISHIMRKKKPDWTY